MKTKYLLIYLVLTITLKITCYRFYTNFLSPIISIILLILLIIYQRKNYIRESHNSKYFIYLVIITLIYLVGYFYLGFIFGFWKNPYNTSLLGIIKNILTIIPPIITIELLRFHYLKKNSNLVLLTIIFILLEVNYYTIIKLLISKAILFKYLCSIIIPLIASNLLCNYLTLNYSYKLSLTFRILNKLFLILLPIIPSLDWFLIGTIEIVGRTLIYVLFKYKFQREKGKRRKEKTSFAIISYAFTLFFATFLICFMAGILKYEPIAILSNSMAPLFARGDVLVFEKLNNQELSNLQVGEVIVYKTENRHIVHRIVKVISNSDSTLYITKGDNNLKSDSYLVKIEDIEGVVKFYIKYLGYPAVYLNSYLRNGE